MSNPVHHFHFRGKSFTAIPANIESDNPICDHMRKKIKTRLVLCQCLQYKAFENICSIQTVKTLHNLTSHLNSGLLILSLVQNKIQSVNDKLITKCFQMCKHSGAFVQNDDYENCYFKQVDKLM